MRFYERSVSSTRVECAKWKPFKKNQKRIPKLSQTYLKSLSMSKGPIIFTKFGLKPTGAAARRTSVPQVGSDLMSKERENHTVSLIMVTLVYTKSSKSYVQYMYYNECTTSFYIYTAHSLTICSSLWNSTHASVRHFSSFFPGQLNCPLALLINRLVVVDDFHRESELPNHGIYGIKRLEIVHCILYTEFALQCLAVLNPFCHILPGCEVIGPSLSWCLSNQ